MKATFPLWCATPDAIKHMDPTDPESIRSWSSIQSAESDMSSYGWTRVGTATVEFRLDSQEQIIPRVMKAFDAAEAEELKKHQERMATLFQARQEFLALEAPSHV